MERRAEVTYGQAAHPRAGQVARNSLTENWDVSYLVNAMVFQVQRLMRWLLALASSFLLAGASIACASPAVDATSFQSRMTSPDVICVALGVTNAPWSAKRIGYRDASASADARGGLRDSAGSQSPSSTISTSALNTLASPFPRLRQVRPRGHIYRDSLPELSSIDDLSATLGRGM